MNDERATASHQNTRDQEKILKASREEMWEIHTKNQNDTVFLKARRKQNNSFKILRFHPHPNYQLNIREVYRHFQGSLPMYGSVVATYKRASNRFYLLVFTPLQCFLPHEIWLTYGTMEYCRMNNM